MKEVIEQVYMGTKEQQMSDFMFEKLQQRVAALENRLVNVTSAVEGLERKESENRTRLMQVEGELSSLKDLVFALEKQLQYAKEAAEVHRQIHRGIIERLQAIEKGQQEVHHNDVTVDMNVINACGEISLPQEEVPILHVIDDRSLWIDEILQLIDKMSVDTLKFKDQWVPSMRATNESIAYHERNILNSLRMQVVKMVGDNPILVRRQK